MKIKSALLTQMSGSIGGMTGAHNRGGLYLRARTVPVDTATARQQQVRTAFSELVVRWTDTLTPAQREAWNLYGQNVLVTDTLGDPRPRSGQNWFIACNTPRLQANAVLGTDLEIIDSAPTTFDRGDFQLGEILELNPTVGYQQEIDDNSPGTNPQNAILVFQGRPRNISRAFFKGPWRLVGIQQGDATPPEQITIGSASFTIQGWPLNGLQATQIVLAQTLADGRLSTRRVAYSGVPNISI